MRELKVATERKTQLLNVTDRVLAALVFLAEFDGPRERTLLLAVTR